MGEPNNQQFLSFTDGTIDPRLLTSKPFLEDEGFEAEKDMIGSSYDAREDVFEDYQDAITNEWGSVEYPLTSTDLTNSQYHMLPEANVFYRHQGACESPNILPNAFASQDFIAPSHTEYTRFPIPYLHHQPLQIAHAITQTGRPLLPKPIDAVTQEEPVIQDDPGAERKNPRTRKRKKPEELKKNKRKEEKPEKCPCCGKGFPDTREWKRHLVSNHRPEAKKMGLDVSKCKCKCCGEEFDNIRKDRLHNHMKRKHPDYSY